uniref:Uncharacterized protein n=1 Tax=Tanacetum cinerariifolium TaxID=118510 RepID=A0A699GM77_TANCI|nr:hypothetical protein [Tanacetum cinerariifolium]
MGDENPILTLGDYSKPSHEGYRNTIELPVRNNMVPLRSDTIRPSSTHIPQAYAEAVYSNPPSQNQNEPPKQNPFTFRGPNPQPQALGTTFEARVRDYMATHTKRMKRFKNAIFKQCEEINDRMTEVFRLLKEVTTNRAFEKVLIREEAKFPVTKNVNSLSLTRGEEERSDKTDVTTENDIEKRIGTETEMPVKEAEKEDEVESEPNRKARKEETIEGPRSQPVEYYLKHRINEKLIEGLVVSLGMGRKNKTSPRMGDEVRPMEEQKFQRQPKMKEMTAWRTIGIHGSIFFAKEWGRKCESLGMDLLQPVKDDS